MISETQLQPNANNFTLTRLLLSTAVIFSHSFDLSTGHGGSDPLNSWFGQTSLSYFAVNGFFFLSGFLVTGSFCKQPVAVNFGTARAARILPGYAVNLVLTVIILGLFVSSEEPRAYFGDVHSWAYILKNVIPIKMQNTLPGVFAGNPYPLAVNGSLWTIPLELLCYAALCVAGVAGLLGNKRAFIIALGLFGLLQVSWWAYGYQVAAEHGLTNRVAQMVRLSLSFSLGVAAYQYRARVRTSWIWLCAMVAIAMIYFAFGIRTALVDELARAVLPAYFVLCLSFSTAHEPIKRISRHDISFGLYIYAFPVQQIIYCIDPGLSPVGNMALTLLVTAPIALLSWVTIEKPALDWSKRIRRRSLNAAIAA